MSTSPTRREILRNSLAWLGAAAVGPISAAAVDTSATDSDDAGGTADDRRSLIVVHLAGGNDGLNTLVPFDNDLYYRFRPRLGIPARETLVLSDGVGLHGAAVGLKALYDEGRLAIVQGVGYPGANRSHAMSLDIWRTADPEVHRRGDRLAPDGRAHVADCGAHADLSDQLKAIADRIRRGGPAHTYHARLGGFDTHSDQLERHRRLLGQFGTALEDLVHALASDGLLDRVLVMAFSEFGRRARENARGGTDHGEAGPVFLCGTRVVPGLHGPAPDLLNLRRGGLPLGVDFRRVYAAILRDWLRVPGNRFAAPGIEALPVICA